VTALTVMLTLKHVTGFRVLTNVDPDGQRATFDLFFLAAEFCPAKGAVAGQLRSSRGTTIGSISLTASRPREPVAAVWFSGRQFDDLVQEFIVVPLMTPDEFFSEWLSAVPLNPGIAPLKSGQHYTLPVP